MNASRVTLARIDAALTLATQPSPRTTASMEHSKARAGYARAAVAVDDDVHRRRRQREQRPPHGQQRRLQDVERIDLGRIRPAHAEANAACPDHARQSLADRGRKQLRVREAPDTSPGYEDHRGRNDGPGKGSSPGLVDAGRQPQQ